MKQIQRWDSRAVTVGRAALNSARKDGQTLQFFYYIFLSGKWKLFDIRVASRVLREPIPLLMTNEEIEACRVSGMYEALLIRDLRRVAQWCDNLDDISFLGE